MEDGLDEKWDASKYLFAEGGHDERDVQHYLAPASHGEILAGMYKFDKSGMGDGNENGDTPMESVTEGGMQESAKIWNNLIMISGGSLALHKTSWRILAWEMVQGELKLVQATNERIIMEDGKGDTR